MATKLSTAQAAKFAARRREVMAKIADLTKEKEAIDSKLLTLAPDSEILGEGIRLSFSPYRSLDTGFIEKKFPPSKNPEFYALKLDTAEFKKHFSANDLETFQKVTYRIKVEDA